MILLIQIKKKNSKKALFNEVPDLSGLFIFPKQSLIDKRFAILVCFIISNSDSNQFAFSYLTTLVSTFKVRLSLDVFIVIYQIRRYQNGVRYSSVLISFTGNPSFRFRLQVATVRDNLLSSICLVNCFTFKSF